MEQILKNTALFINILGMSRTSAVQQWDAEELKRALKWADYFQQVFCFLQLCFLVHVIFGGGYSGVGQSAPRYHGLSCFF